MVPGLAPFGILSTVLVGARALAEAAGRVARAFANRGAVHRLAHLDDRALRDIGLTRSDVAGALAQPLLTDPSQVLVSRRGRARLRPVAPVTAAAGRPSARMRPA